MENLLILAVIACILSCAGLYIHKKKKAGVKCIGCPDSRTCSGHCGSCPGCGEEKN